VIICFPLSYVAMMKHDLFDSCEDIGEVSFGAVSETYVRGMRLLIGEVSFGAVSETYVRGMRLLIGEDPGVVIVADDLYASI